MSAPPQARTARRSALLGAEIGLLVLGMGAAITFTRLFEGWAWLGRLTIPVAVSWALSVLLRRTGTGVALSSAVQVGVAVLVLSWQYAADTLALFLPTPATWTELASQVASSFSSFSELVAPVPATDGFLFVISAALWTIGTFADIAALRYRAPVQAAVPYVASFVAVGILARDSGRTTSAVAFALALGVFAVTERALAATERRWVAGRMARGTGAVFSGALAIALVAVIGGMALGPLLPGSTRPVIDLRQLGTGDGPRTVVSPFVGIRSLLGERSDQVMFTVRADDQAYWRLTSLERYDPDRQIWVSRSSFRPTDGELPPTMDAEVDSRPLLQEYRMEALSTVWLPAAYVPRRVDSPAPLGFDPDSASLFLRDSDDDEGGLRYQLESQLPDLAPVIDSARVGRAADLDPEYLTTPPIDADTLALLASVTAGAEGPYRQLLALQDWFRSEFTYDDGVDFSREPDALGAFLATRRGFCQQFASTFAVFARSLGIPSRVAVGFTPGDPVATDDAEGVAPDSGDPGAGAEESTSEQGGSEFVVRGRHAHAWPEVHFEGIGWVPFEPTPQRGNPQAQDYTGVAPDQAAAPSEQAVSTTTTSTAPPTSATTPTTSPTQVDATGSPEITETTTGSTGDWALALVLVVVTLVLVGGSAWFAARRRPRRATHRGDAHDAAVAVAWSDAIRALRSIGLEPRTSETPVEFALRADGTLTGVSLGPLAAAETQRRFGRLAASAADVETAQDAAARVVEQVRDITTRRQRVAARMTR